MANLIGSGPAQLSTNQMLGTMAFQDSQNYLQKVDGVMGYPKGMGGTVTQLTSKSTAVTLNAPCGQITMNNAALAANTGVSFQLNNSLADATDIVVVTLSAVGSTAYTSYSIVGNPFSLGVVFSLKNITGVSIADAPVINFAIIKGQTS